MVEIGKSGAGSAREMITFLLGQQEFCVDVMSVREIRGWTPSTPLPHSPPYVIGIVNLRGAVLPIVDLATRLGFAPTEPGARHAFLVVEMKGQLIGLLVEGVTEIMTVSESLIQPTPETASEASRFVSGIIVSEGRMISVLALEAVAPQERLAAA